MKHFVKMLPLRYQIAYKGIELVELFKKSYWMSARRRLASSYDKYIDDYFKAAKKD